MSENSLALHLPMPDQVLDVHQHVGALVVHAQDDGAGAWTREADQRRRQELMDRFQVGRAVIAPSLQYERPNGWRDTCVLNDSVAAYRDSLPDRFPAAFGTVDLLSGTENCVTELTRLRHELAMVGVMWHHRYQGMFLDDARMHPLLEASAELGLVAAVHLFADSAMEAPDALERIALAHPDTRFLVLDGLTAFAQVKALLPILERCPNLILDTAGAFPLGRMVDLVARSVGSDRLVFGSDMYASPKMWNYPAGLLDVITSEELDLEQQRAILHGNAVELLGLDQP